MVLEPTEQGAGQVQGQRKALGALQMRQQWPVDIGQVLLEYRIEVSDGLMDVEAEREANWRLHEGFTGPGRLDQT